MGIFVENGAGTDLIQHEYGHKLTYDLFGADFYYRSIAPLSLYNSMENKFEEMLFGHTVFSVPHSNYWTETLSNSLSKDYFGKNIDKDFNRYFPTTTGTTPFTWYQRLIIYGTILKLH